MKTPIFGLPKGNVWMMGAAVPGPAKPWIWAIVSADPRPEKVML